MAPDGKTAYVSGLPDSDHKDEKAPPGTPGLDGDVIHVFTYNPGTGIAQRAGLIPVPPPSGATAPPGVPTGGSNIVVPAPQSFPPTDTKPISWPRDLAISPDGRTLVAALNLADRAAIVDLQSKQVSYVSVGSYPYGAAITRDGKRVLISNEADGTVSVIDLASKQKVGDVQVGGHLSHPEGIAVDPKTDLAYVAVASEDKVAVVNTASMTLERSLPLARPQGIGTEPTALTVTADGCRLLVADSGEDAVAIFALRPGCGGHVRRHRGRHHHARRHRARRHRARGSGAAAFTLIGRVPVGSYPVFAGAPPGRQGLIWVAAKGLGVGPTPNGPNPLSKNDSDDAINSFQYLPSIVSGMSGVAPFPTDAETRRLNTVANAQLMPANAERAPAGTPLAPGGPIKHVFYIVRENRTYDQVLGDDPRGDGDPKLELFDRNITPNVHALVKRFPLLDHVFANSEASIDGHFWTSASAVSDYVVKNWHQNYAGRDRPYDFGVYAITWPAKRFIFDAAQDQGISYFNYGEAVAGVVPFPDKDRTPEETQQVQTKFSHSDLGDPGITLGGLQVPATNCYPNDASIGKDAVTQNATYDATLPSGAPPGSASRVDCFRKRFSQQLAMGSVPALNYLVLPSDHTNGLTPGARTPQAMIADNDYAVGQIVDTISHSSIWMSSMILVVEDDSQDGADHLDAHRIPALAISPYTKRGAVIRTRYDFPSFTRTLELPIGMHPFNLFDATATPLYDAFDPAPQNAQPFDAIAPNIDINAKNPSTSSSRALARQYDLYRTDRVPQRVLDEMLWHAVKGPRSKPPPPGPNADLTSPDADG
jgi:YVTN family beta-propeller protein